ncbi:MAG: PCRF domain-containing protein, partial [Muribaculaceae bacterium]|nr:PCRF domain-containing protein [Muribaculaceae bacterium]
MSTILERLDGLDAKFDEISTLITDPAVIADQKRYVRLTKEYHDLEKILKTADRYRTTLSNIEEAKSIIAVETDDELRAMAREELEEAQARIPKLEEEIKLLMIPPDPDDSKNCVVEIRGGTG